MLKKFFGPPTRNQFARDFQRELQRCGVERTEYDPENFSVRCHGGTDDGQIYNLGNFYVEHCRLPRSERAAHLRQSVMACLSSRQELPDEFEHAKPDLRLKLWCRATIEKMRLQARGEGKELDLPLVDVGLHLYASVVYDLPRALRSIDCKELDDWGVTVYEALEAGRHNLLEDDFAFANLGDRLYAAVTGDSYDSSRLLLVDLIRRLEVRGDHAAMVPSRDSLLITGSDDEPGLEMMLALAEQAAENPRPMLFTPLRLEGDDWVDWMPPRAHPLSGRFQLLEAKYLFVEYEEQKKLLDALHEAESIDIFIASYTAMQKDERIFSYCVWSKGVDSLLPRTQQIMFFDGAGIVAGGEWEHVTSVLGDLIEETDLYPPRFRARKFPSEEQLRRIGQIEGQA